VGDAAEAVLDGVDGLTHKHLTKLKLKHHQQILGTILSVLYIGYFLSSKVYMVQLLLFVWWSEFTNRPGSIQFLIT